MLNAERLCRPLILWPLCDHLKMASGSCCQWELAWLEIFLKVWVQDPFTWKQLDDGPGRWPWPVQDACGRERVTSCSSLTSVIITGGSRSASCICKTLGGAEAAASPLVYPASVWRFPGWVEMSFECVSGERRRWTHQNDGCFCSLADSCSCRHLCVLEVSLHYAVDGKWHWASSSLLLACMGGHGAKWACLCREDKHCASISRWLIYVAVPCVFIYTWKCDSCQRLKFLLPSSLSFRILATLQWPMNPRLWSDFTMGRCAARRTSLEHLSERSSEWNVGGLKEKLENICW